MNNKKKKNKKHIRKAIEFDLYKYATQYLIIVYVFVFLCDLYIQMKMFSVVYNIFSA